MSASNPVEKAVETAAALSSPATAPVIAAKASWWALNNPKRFALLAGAAVLTVGGWYGYKHFTAEPAKAKSQTEPPALAQSKPEEPAKLPPLPDEPATEVKPASKRNVDPDLLLDLPPVPPSKPGNNDTDPPLLKIPVHEDTRSKGADTDPPVLKLPTQDDKSKGTDTAPPLLTIPPTSDEKGKTGSKGAPDPFKSSDALPTTVRERKEKPADTPIITIGAQDTTPKKDDSPPIPKLDLDPPAPPPMPKMGDPPAIPDVPKINLDSPPDPMKKDETKPVGPAPKSDDPPLPPIRIPRDDDPPPPPMKSPTIPDLPPTPPIKIDSPPPPVGAGVKPAKKDEYDEDWHARRDGDTYVLISKEYYKTPDYARALEAYNRDRFKMSEGIIRVPPTWVLEEQFPTLIGAKPEKAPEPKAKDNVKFEPADPKPGSDRLAPPPPAIGSSDEYRVKAENGESIRDIARKAYGDANAWKKLWELNPGLDPTQPIPNGTTLRLGR